MNLSCKIDRINLEGYENGETKPVIISLFSNLINSSKHFKNNFVFQENYNRKVIHPKYFRLVMNVLLVLWQNCKQKRKCKIENLDTEYYKNLSAVINLDEKKYDTRIENKFMNDVFFMMSKVEIFYNSDLKGQYKKGRFEDSFRSFNIGMTDQLKRC